MLGYLSDISEPILDLFLSETTFLAQGIFVCCFKIGMLYVFQQPFF